MLFSIILCSMSLSLRAVCESVIQESPLPHVSVCVNFNYVNNPCVFSQYCVSLHAFYIFIVNVEVGRVVRHCKAFIRQSVASICFDLHFMVNLFGPWLSFVSVACVLSMVVCGWCPEPADGFHYYVLDKDNRQVWHRACTRHFIQHKLQQGPLVAEADQVARADQAAQSAHSSQGSHAPQPVRVPLVPPAQHAAGAAKVSSVAPVVPVAAGAPVAPASFIAQDVNLRNWAAQLDSVQVQLKSRDEQMQLERQELNRQWSSLRASQTELQAGQQRLESQRVHQAEVAASHAQHATQLEQDRTAADRMKAHVLSMRQQQEQESSRLSQLSAQLEHQRAQQQQAAVRLSAVRSAVASEHREVAVGSPAPRKCPPPPPPPPSRAAGGGEWLVAPSSRPSSTSRERSRSSHGGCHG